jgi:hypothetical protein
LIKKGRDEKSIQMKEEKTSRKEKKELENIRKN